MSLDIEGKRERERSHRYLCGITTKENQIFSLVVNPKCSRNETRLVRTREMKQPNGRLFIGNNNNKDRKKKKKKKTSLCIYCKKIIRKKNIRTWFILNPYSQFHLH